MDLGRLYCFSCKDLMVGAYYTFGGRHFHAVCFLCETCQTSLEKGFYKYRGSHFLCENCYQEAIAKRLPCCPFCKQKVGVGKLVRAVNLEWHTECFVCRDCKARLETEYFNIGVRVYFAKCIEKHDNEEDHQQQVSEVSTASSVSDRGKEKNVAKKPQPAATGRTEKQQKVETVENQPNVKTTNEKPTVRKGKNQKVEIAVKPVEEVTRQTLANNNECQRKTDRSKG